MTDPLHRLLPDVVGDPIAANHGAESRKLVANDLWRREGLMEIGEVRGEHKRVKIPCGGGAGQNERSTERDEDGMTSSMTNFCEELERIRIEQEVMMKMLFERVEILLAHVAEETVGNATLRRKQLGTGSTMNGRSKRSGASSDAVCGYQPVLLESLSDWETTHTGPVGSQHVAKQRLTEIESNIEEEYVGDLGMDKGGPDPGDEFETANTLKLQVEAGQEEMQIDMGEVQMDEEGMDYLGEVGNGRVVDNEGEEMDGIGHCGNGDDGISGSHGSILDKMGYPTLDAEMTVREGEQGAVLRLPLAIREAKMGGELTSLADALRRQEGEV